MVTAATYRKVHHFGSRKRLRYLTGLLLSLAAELGWDLEAWSVFANHYHFIAKSPAEGALSLSEFLRTLHRQSSRWVNCLDGVEERKVWHNYRETELTYQRSYLARLNYVIQNPVKHALVKVAADYPWCSAGWFEREASPAFRKTVESFKTDKVKVEDDFDL